MLPGSDDVWVLGKQCWLSSDVPELQGFSESCGGGQEVDTSEEWIDCHQLHGAWQEGAAIKLQKLSY